MQLEIVVCYNIHIDIHRVTQYGHIRTLMLEVILQAQVQLSTTGMVSDWRKMKNLSNQHLYI